MHFSELNLHPRLERAVAERGYAVLTPVQEKTLTVTLRGRDAAVQSQTGTGKTAAFLITILEKFLRERLRRKKTALIIAPTRELAAQIEGEALLLNRHAGFTVGCLVGGVGYAGQEKLLDQGLDIAVGTPGRLLDFADKGRLRLKDVGVLVIDEADRLFDMGFLPDIKRLMRKMPPRGIRQGMLFSATLNRISRDLAYEHLDRPVYIELTPEQMTVDTVVQKLYRVKSHVKTNLLLGILKKQNPRNALIFTNQRHNAERLALRLERNGYRCRHLSGDLPQSRRQKVMDDFMAGKFPFLVATDVAARGLHIEGLEMVFNYDLPQDHENYVHRIGRTARAGACGQAVSFLCEKFGRHLEAIESFIGQKLTLETPNIDDYETDRSLEFDDRHPGRGGREGERDSRRGRGGPARGRRRSSAGRRP